MQAVVNGVRYRLRFIHYFKPGVKGKRGRQGTTTCFVETWSKREAGATTVEGWVPIASGQAVCGRSERGFYKEQGRQFSLVRALRSGFLGDTNELKGALVTAYIKSGPEIYRTPCVDLQVRGYSNIYDAVFRYIPALEHPYEGEVDAA